MANALKNAGFLDNANNWQSVNTSITAPDLYAVEDSHGAPGRAALRGGGTASAAGASLGVALAPANRIACSAGDAIEIYGCVFATRGTPVLEAVFRSSLGTQVGSPVTVPLIDAGDGAGLYGMRGSYRRHYGVITPPGSTASVDLRARTTIAANGDAGAIFLLKPFLRLGGIDGVQSIFDPGGSDNPDLAKPRWPDGLPGFIAGSLSEPYPARTSFAVDAGDEVTRRLGGRSKFKFTAKMLLTPMQFEVLEQFFQAAYPRFYVVQPDTDRLCFGSWLDSGQPKITNNEGPLREVQCGLKLVVA